MVRLKRTRFHGNHFRPRSADLLIGIIEKMASLTTELRNPNSEQIDSLSSFEIVSLINAEDRLVAPAIESELTSIGQAVDLIVSRLQQGGRLLYIGAGTSGRLGVLDASECPPTFSTAPGLVVGIIAGGERALTNAIEGAEDREELALEDVKRVELSSRDVLVGIATSGRTPYVIAALRYAREIGAATIGIACNRGSAMESDCDVMIAPIVGPEVISGSTRMKAGTATKMVLNMLSTGTMIRLGKTFGNLMVDLKATNTKLKDRSRRIVQELTDLDHDAASTLLTQCNGEVKTAIVAHLRCVSADRARELLQIAGGHLRKALQQS